MICPCSPDSGDLGLAPVPRRPWRRRLQAGMVPVTVGLIITGAALLVTSTSTGMLTSSITLAVTVAMLATRLHPLALLVAGAAASLWFDVG